MLTWSEVAITVTALLAVVYDAHVFAATHGTRGWAEMRLAAYALLNITPKLIVILYAFLQFAAD